MKFALALAVLLLVGFSAFCVEPDSPGLDSGARTYLLIASRPVNSPPTRQEKIGMATLRLLVEAAEASRGEFIVDMGNQKVAGGKSLPFKERLAQITRIAGPQDTVVIYTHSHGLRSQSPGEEYIGGLALDQPSPSSPRGVLPWNEYADLILSIPAKNVVVLTMSCFSGELINSLNEPARKAQWENRRRKENRNLVILTSQNDSLRCGPIVKQSEIINPFALAFYEMLGGAADEHGDSDGKLSVGEMIDYILHATANIDSDFAQFKNNSKPQKAGSFDRNDILSYGTPSSKTTASSIQERLSTVDGKTQWAIAKAFLTNDEDGDGRVTREEAESVVANAYDEFDQNSDGVVGSTEFKNVALRFVRELANGRSALSQSARISQLFSRNDDNGDGKITREEARTFVADAFGEFDRDGDGGVSSEEFADTVRSRQSQFRDAGQAEKLLGQRLLGIAMKPAGGTGDGLTVTNTLKGSRAVAAGIKVGDRILKIDGKSTDSIPMVRAAVRNGGKKLSVELERDGETLDIVVEFEQ